MGTRWRVSASGPEVEVLPVVAMSLSGSSSDSEVELAAADAYCNSYTRLILLPVRVMTMFGLACHCSSFTHVLAFLRLKAFVTSYTATVA